MVSILIHLLDAPGTRLVSHESGGTAATYDVLGRNLMHMIYDELCRHDTDSTAHTLVTLEWEVTSGNDEKSTGDSAEMGECSYFWPTVAASVLTLHTTGMDVVVTVWTAMEWRGTLRPGPLVNGTYDHMCGALVVSEMTACVHVWELEKREVYMAFLCTVGELGKNDWLWANSSGAMLSDPGANGSAEVPWQRAVDYDTEIGIRSVTGRMSDDTVVTLNVQANSAALIGGRVVVWRTEECHGTLHAAGAFHGSKHVEEPVEIAYRVVLLGVSGRIRWILGGEDRATTGEVAMVLLSVVVTEWECGSCAWASRLSEIELEPSCLGDSPMLEEDDSTCETEKVDAATVDLSHWLSRVGKTPHLSLYTVPLGWTHEWETVNSTVMKSSQANFLRRKW